MAFPKLTSLKRLRGDVTLETVAGETGISVSQVSRYESGDRDPKLSDLRKLASYFSISVAQLIGEEPAAADGATNYRIRETDFIQVEVRQLRDLIVEALTAEEINYDEAFVYATGVLGLLTKRPSSAVVLSLSGG